MVWEPSVILAVIEYWVSALYCYSLQVFLSHKMSEPSLNLDINRIFFNFKLHWVVREWRIPQHDLVYALCVRTDKSLYTSNCNVTMENQIRAVYKFRWVGGWKENKQLNLVKDLNFKYSGNNVKACTVSWLP